MPVINQYRFIHLVSMQWDNKTKIVFIHNKIVFCQHKNPIFYWHNGKNKLFNEYLTGYRWLPDRRPPVTRLLNWFWFSVKKSAKILAQLFSWLIDENAD